MDHFGVHFAVQGRPKGIAIWGIVIFDSIGDKKDFLENPNDQRTLCRLARDRYPGISLAAGIVFLTSEEFAKFRRPKRHHYRVPRPYRPRVALT